MRILMLTAAAIAVLVFCPRASNATLDDAIAATCRISTPDGGRGSGTVYAIDGNRVYILTCAHVVAAQNVQCEFWSAGHQSSPLPATLVARSERADVAALVIDAGYFSGRLPRAIPLAPRGTVLAAGAPLSSAGCASGAWVTAWQGHVRGYMGPERLTFVPPPANGRSGSAILSGDGERIVGLLNARSDEEGIGLAVSLETVYRCLNGQTSQSGTASVRMADRPLVPVVECAPGGCAPGGCAPGGSQRRDGFVLPYRNKIELEIGNRGGGGGAYPTLPPIAQLPTPPPDLSPILDRLDRIAQSIPQQSASAPPAPTGPDPQTVQALQSLGGAVQQTAGDLKTFKDEVPKLIDGKLEPISSTLKEVKEGTAVIQRLHAKLEADAEAGGIRGRIAGRILNMGEGTVADDGEGVVKRLGKTEFIIMGVVAFLILCWRMHAHAQKTGQPNLVEREVDKLKERLQGAAIANPALAPLAGLVTAVDKIHDRLGAHEKAIQEVALNTPPPGQAATQPPQVNITATGKPA